MKQTIAIDIDDVLANSTELMRVTANQLMGLDLQQHHYAVTGPYWSYYQHVLEQNGITDKKVQKDMFEYWMTIHGRADPIDGAVEALTKLSQRFNVILVTSRNPNIRADTQDWLKAHFGGLYQDLHMLGHFKIIDNPKTKGEACAEIGAKWLIDDNPEHCLSAIEHGTEAVLFGEYGWHFDAPEHLTRCKDWPAVLEYFDNTTS